MDHQVADIQRMFDQERPYVDDCSVANCHNPACVMASHANGKTPFCLYHSDISFIGAWREERGVDVNEIYNFTLNEIK